MYFNLLQLYRAFNWSPFFCIYHPYYLLYTFSISMRKFQRIGSCISNMHDLTSLVTYHFLLLWTQYCAFHLFPKFGNFNTYNFKQAKKLKICFLSESDSSIVSHASITVFYTWVNLIFFSSLLFKWKIQHISYSHIFEILKLT